MLRVVPRPGNKKTMRHVKDMPRRVRRGIQNGFLEIRKDLKPHTVKGMKEAKSGQVYTTYLGRGGRKLKRPRLHQASAPGQMPAILTGRLMKSLGYEVKYGVILRYGANTKYAKSLETNKKADRSYLLRTIVDNRRNIRNSLTRSIEREAKAWKARKR